MNNIQNYSHIAANKFLLLSLPLLAASASAGEQPEVTEAAASPDLLTSLKVTLTHSGTTGVVEITEGLGKMRRWFDADEPTILHIALGNQQTGEGMEAGIYRLTVRAEYGTGVTAEVTLDIIVPDVTGDGVDEVTPMPLRANDTLLPDGAGGGGMEQYVLGYDGTHITHDGEPLTFEQVKEAVEDKSKFVYLNYANALHLPCFIVDGTSSAVAFSAAFQVSGAPFIERVAINEAEEVKVDNMRCVHFNDVNGVAIGDDCVTNGQSSHAEGNQTKAIGDYSHAEGDQTTAYVWASHAEGDQTNAGGDYSHAEGCSTDSRGTYSHAEGQSTVAEEEASHAEGYSTVVNAVAAHAQGFYNDPNDFSDGGEFMHGCGTSETDRKNAFGIASDGKIYVIGLGGYNGKNHTEALSLQELLGLGNIKTTSNKAVNGYQVPNLTAEQVTAAYNAVVAGRPMTITDATDKYHLAVMQADSLEGGVSISIIYLNVMLVSYTVSGNTVDVQFKNL